MTQRVDIGPADSENRTLDPKLGEITMRLPPVMMKLGSVTMMLRPVTMRLRPVTVRVASGHGSMVPRRSVNLRIGTP